MKIRCFYCGKSVSSELSDDVVLRATVECPECAALCADDPNRVERVSDLLGKRIAAAIVTGGALDMDDLARAVLKVVDKPSKDFPMSHRE